MNAREGFWRLLRRKRINPRWIEANAEDLFAQAQQEYAQWLEERGAADSPDGWLVNCAWWRAKDLLKAEGRRKPTLPIDDAAYLADESTPAPDQVAITHEQRERLRQAMEFLDPKDRQLLTLAYFEGYSIREAGRTLGWGKSTVDRHHGKALEKLHAILDGRVELPAAEIGLAAWIAVEVEARSVGSLAVLGDLAHEWVLIATHRGAELWRRMMPAAEPANASLAGAGVRTAGICAAATVACLATAIVAPGDAAKVLGGDDRAPRAGSPAHPRTLLSPLPQPTHAVRPSRLPRRPDLPGRRSAPSSAAPVARRDAGSGPAPGPTQRQRAQTNSEFAVEGMEFTPEEAARPVTENDPIAPSRPSGVAARPVTGATQEPDPPPPSNAASGPAPSDEFGL